MSNVCEIATNYSGFSMKQLEDVLEQVKKRQNFLQNLYTSGASEYRTFLSRDKGYTKEVEELHKKRMAIESVIKSRK